MPLPNITFITFALLLLACRIAWAGPMPQVTVAKDQTGFILEPSGRAFVPWGFNYDRDHKLRLLEDYWETEWSTVEDHFRQMKQLGANVIRVHLQLGQFMDSPQRPTQKALDRLAQLVKLAQDTNLYLDITGLGCYHRKDIPAWYDTLSEEDRWNVQARFWEAIAKTCANSPAVFCYDLMNEPVAPGTKQKDGDWLVGPPLGGKQYVQYITLDPKGRSRGRIAQQWVHTLVSAIRKQDPRHLITVGLLPGVPERADAWSGFNPRELTNDLDFISVHMYPEKAKVPTALAILSQFAVGKPVVIEEIFPMSCSVGELDQFIDQSRRHACGWIGFYWGKTPDQLRQSKDIGDLLTLGWLDYFQKKTKDQTNTK